MMRWYVLENLIKKNGWKKGAELGVWKGATYKHLLKACPDLELTGVDLYAPQPDNKGPEKWVEGENGHDWDHERYYNEIMHFANKRDNAHFLRMTTAEAATHIKDGSLDFVFIDADHSYEGVFNDIVNWAPKVKKGGAVMGHDIDWDGVVKAVEENFDAYSKLDDNVWMVIK